MKPNLQLGDVFCVGSAGPLSHVILAIEKFHSKDNEALYGHSGIITSAGGRTFEALTTIRAGSLSRYRDREVLIARPVYRHDTKKVETSDIATALSYVMARNAGHLYPAWRLPLFLFPPLAKYFTLNGRFLVCSEVVAQYEAAIKVIKGPYTGRMPDDLSDRWINSWTYAVLYRGPWIW